ncbi:MAG: YciI family protein [Hyphomonadaceae bacterium]|nr:YciI family protein [Hyphomonadaceae bacterium]
MRFMMLMYPGPQAETEQSPVPEGPEGQKLLHDMMAFNQRMVDAGVMLGGEGLKPTRQGARVKYAGGGKTIVVDGPFTETKEVLGGYWIIDVPSLADAVAWARQAPCPAGEFVEIRPVWMPEDFGAEAAAIEHAQMAQMEAQKRD